MRMLALRAVANKAFCAYNHFITEVPFFKYDRWCKDVLLI